VSKHELKDKLIIALDVDTEKDALAFVHLLKTEVGIFKVGSELFTSCGPSIVEKVKKEGRGVFLDLKFHDIPNTVKKSAIAATRLGVSIFNVHSLGGYDMMKLVSEAVRDEAARLKIEKPKVIAVTILTSMDTESLKRIGVRGSAEDAVLRLARLAKEAGLEGVVASAAEIRRIRETIGKDFIIVTPGVRPTWASKNDQKRVTTPSDAVKDGADYIVVGRPIIEAEDPCAAARKILEEIG